MATGPYENPKRGIDKQFEAVRLEQNKLWGNVASNIATLARAEAARARKNANRLNKYYDLYDRGMKPLIKDSNEILANNDVQSDEALQLGGAINKPFIQGKKMIRDLIESGADDYEIRKAIDENIAGARGYATSLGLINEASNAWSTAVNKGSDGNDGKTAGSALITGNNFANTFDALNGVDVGKLKLMPGGSGNPFDQVLWYDANGDGKFAADGTEILDLKGLEGAVMDGKFTVKTMPEEEVMYSKNFMKQIMDGLNDDTYQIQYNKIVADPTQGNAGVSQKGKRRNAELQYNAFMSNAAGSLGGSVSKHIRDVEGGVATYYQNLFGANALADAMEAGMTEDEMMYRVKDEMYKTKIDPFLDGGSSKLAKAKSTSYSIRTYEDETSDEAVRAVSKSINDRMNGAWSTMTVNQPGGMDNAVNEFTQILRGETINGQQVTDVFNGSLTGDAVNGYTVGDVDSGIITLLDDQGVPLKTVNTLDQAAWKELKTDIAQNHFRKGRNQDAVQYLFDQGNPAFDDEIPDKSSSTVTSTPGMAEIEISEQDQFGAPDQDYSQSEKFDPNYDTSGGIKNPYDDKDIASVYQNNIGGKKGNTVSITAQNIGNYSNASMKGNVVQFDFGGKVVDQSAFVNNPVDTKSFGQQAYIGNMFNIESSMGSSSGDGLDNFGFTGDRFKQNGLKPPTTPQEALDLVNQEIIGDPDTKTKSFKVDDGQGGTKTKEEPSIMYELNHVKGSVASMSVDQWKQLEKANPEIAKILVDYKFNTGRSIKDLITIAGGGAWSGKKAAGATMPDNLLSDLVDKFYKDPANAGLAKEDVLLKFLESLDVDKLKEARKRLYLDRNGDKTKIDNAWNNSQQYRV